MRFWYVVTTVFSMDASIAFQMGGQRSHCISQRKSLRVPLIREPCKEVIRLNASDKDDNDLVDSTRIKPERSLNNEMLSRRRALQFIPVTAVALTVVPLVANAGKAEIDNRSGELFSPKKQMLGGGGSDLARGIKLESRNRQTGKFEANDAPIQVVYEPRFITYLSRFLLNFDPAAKSWWEEQDFNGNSKNTVDVQKKIRFAEFAESVEVGLADYFLGPYGSYASVQAAKAGLSAQMPATSSTSGAKAVKTGFFDSVKKKIKGETYKPLADKKEREKARQGILNLFSLLQARYTHPEEKRQLALLFSFISDPKLQPAKEIKSILGEADDACISGIEIEGLLQDGAAFRGSSHHGGGYEEYESPTVVVDPPPGLGSSYKPAKIEVTTKPTSRLLRIKLLSGGKGYTSIPKVEITQQSGVKVPCEATAILDRNGSVESVIVLDPGLGYGILNKRNNVPPSVTISPPKIPRGEGKKNRNNYAPAIAVAKLEYMVDKVKIVDGGNGYILDQSPRAVILPPEEDADWYMSPIDRRTWKAVDLDQLEVKVVSMTSKSSEGLMTRSMDTSLQEMDPIIFDELARDPLALLPSSVRLQFTATGDRIQGLEANAVRNGYYGIPSLPVSTSQLSSSIKKFRAFDPIFGAIGSKPVTKNAQALTGSEYTRLAISGGICTVLVRTALNPLELVKTKVQLQNDSELFRVIAEQTSEAEANTDGSSSSEKDKENKSVGTLDVFKAMISTRGPSSLFQSADITFYASVVFGSLGFGATELFRRSFTMVFFDESTGGMKSSKEELIVLAAAALATTITSLVAAPFEILRVRSMGYVEAQPVLPVLSDFLNEKRKKRGAASHHDSAEFSLKSIKKDDIPPLFSGFIPIVSRELPFAVTKFLVFDLMASAFVTIINSQPQISEPVQVGAGAIGLLISAGAGAVAGIAGAVISHPADLILTLTSKSSSNTDVSDDSDQGGPSWLPLVKELISKDGGISNLFAGLPARATFFFLVIGLQFFLYDYAKNVFQVGSEDLTLVLDVFYAIRQGLS